MVAQIHGSTIIGSIEAPASKSWMQRTCLMAFMHHQPTTILHPGHSDDDTSMLHLLESLNAKVESVNSSSLIIHPPSHFHFPSQVNVGESGLACRMLIPLLAMHNSRIEIHGIGTILNRTFHWFHEYLPQLGVQVESNEGKLPIKVKGPIKIKSLRVSGADSSQYISGLLTLFAFHAKDEVRLFVDDLKSKPYVDITISLLKEFGCNVEEVAKNEFKILPAESKEEVMLHMEGDWSGMSTLLVAAAINGNLKVKGLNSNSVQGDSKILNVLHQVGARIEFDDDIMHLTGINRLNAFEYDATDTPDLFPALAVLGAFCNGTSRIKGLHRLYNKESNRTESIVEMLKAFGLECYCEEDEMRIIGGVTKQEVNVNSAHDHRIVMAAAAMAIGANTNVTIEHAEAVNKSFPDFFDILENTGVKVSLT